MPTFYSWKQFDIIKDIIKKQGNLLRGIDNFSGVWYQSYEIKLPPGFILGFEILDIFSVENQDRLGVMMYQSSNL